MPQIRAPQGLSGLLSAFLSLFKKDESKQAINTAAMKQKITEFENIKEDAPPNQRTDNQGNVKPPSVVQDQKSIEIKIFDPLKDLINHLQNETAKYTTNLTDREQRLKEFKMRFNLPQNTKFCFKLGISLYIPSTKSDFSIDTVVHILYNDFFVNSISINASEYIQVVQSYDDVYFLFHGHAAETINLSGYLIEPFGTIEGENYYHGQHSLFTRLYYSILSGSSLNNLMKQYAPAEGESLTKQLLAMVILDLGKRTIIGTLANFSSGLHVASQHVYSFTCTFIPFGAISMEFGERIEWLINLPVKTTEPIWKLRDFLRKILQLEPELALEEDSIKIGVAK